MLGEPSHYIVMLSAGLEMSTAESGPSRSNSGNGSLVTSVRYVGACCLWRLRASLTGWQLPGWQPASAPSRTTLRPARQSQEPPIGPRSWLQLPDWVGWRLISLHEYASGDPMRPVGPV